MNLQAKVLLSLCLVIVIFGSGLILVKRFDTQRQYLLLQDREQEAVIFFDKLLELNGSSLRTLVYDYTYWDEMVRFVTTGDSKWAAENLHNEMLSTYAADFVWVYRTDRSLVYSHNNLSAGEMQEIPLPKDEFQRVFDRNRFPHFFVKTERGLMEIRGATIHFSHDPQRTMTPKGYFLAGRVWSEVFLSQLSKATKSKVSLIPFSTRQNARTSDPEEGKIFFSKALHGWDASPIMELHVERDSPFLAELILSSRQQFFLLILFASTILIIIYVFLWRWISIPIQSLATALHREDASLLRNLDNDTSEFGNLAQLIRKFFEQKKKLTEEIIKRERIEATRAQLEEQLRHSQKMEAIGLLAGGVAHDFNNILMAITSYCELLMWKLPKKDPVYRDLEEILKSANQGASLTKQLLAFSRKQVIEPEIIDLNNVIEDLEKMLRRLIGVDIELFVLLGQNAGCIKADAGQLEQVILNLFLNSRDAMPEGGKLILETVGVTLDEAHCRQFPDMVPGSYVMLAISDTGCGMTDEVKSHIFEPFFTTKDRGKGTGLGLSTVYGIVKQSGGDIRVESSPNQGSTFRLYFPRADEPAKDVRPITISKRKAGSETVLLVDDNDVVRSAIKGCLQMNGYTVLEARHGQEALKVWDSHTDPIHLLITDVVMPFMNGQQLAQVLNSRYPDLKILFLSGYAGEEIMPDQLTIPGAEFLNKPISMEILMRKIRELLDSDFIPMSSDIAHS